jgi:hypothetical protein
MPFYNFNMPQLDPFVVCESSVSLLLFFWILTFLFVYILVPLVKLRFVIVSKKNTSDQIEKTCKPFYGNTFKFNDTFI